MRRAARVGQVVTQAWARAACSHPALSGISRAHFGELLEELAPQWGATRESALHERRGGGRRRAAGAGPKQRLVFTDRLLATLVHLRLGLPHAALAELYGVNRSTVSGALHKVRPLLAARGFAVPDRPGVRLRTLEDLFAYTDAEGVELRIDGTEVQVRRPRAGRPGGSLAAAIPTPIPISRSPAWSPTSPPAGQPPPQAKRRTGARPAARLLITHQPTRQAGMPRYQSLPSS